MARTRKPRAADLTQLDHDRDGIPGGSLPDGFRWATEEEQGDGAAYIVEIATGDRAAATADELRATLKDTDQTGDAAEQSPSEGAPSEEAPAEDSPAEESPDEPDWATFSDDPNAWTDDQVEAFQAWTERALDIDEVSETGAYRFKRQDGEPLPEHPGVALLLNERLLDFDNPGVQAEAEETVASAEAPAAEPDWTAFPADPDEWTPEQVAAFQAWLDTHCQLVALGGEGVTIQRRDGQPLPAHPGILTAIHGRKAEPAAEEADIGPLVRPVFAGLTVMFREHNRRFGGLATTPAIITRVHADLVVNLMVLPDGGDPYPRAAVPFEETLDPDHIGRAWSFITL